jgi:hypothetical protein
MFSLLDQYEKLHADPGAFSGRSLNRHAVDIGVLVRATHAETLLDYGCGKAEQYTQDLAHLAWGGIVPTLYDPAVPQFAARPEGTFDGVICTDVLEHVLESDLKLMLRDVFGYARRFVFFSIATRPAKRLLPDGRNAHVTVRDERWWRDRISELRPAGPVVKLAFVDS